MRAGPTQLEMSDSEYRMFCELLRDRCGLFFDKDMRFLVEKRLARRLAKLELGSFAAYRYYLRNGHEGDEEFAGVVDDLTTNETYFFREINQLRALIQEIFEELKLERAGKREQPISVWSAGCSSGARSTIAQTIRNAVHNTSAINST